MAYFLVSVLIIYQFIQSTLNMKTNFTILFQLFLIGHSEILIKILTI